MNLPLRRVYKSWQSYSTAESYDTILQQLYIGKKDAFGFLPYLVLYPLGVVGYLSKVFLKAWLSPADKHE